MNSKKAKIFLIIFIFLLMITSNVFAVVKPTSNFYVNDYANLLTSETENYIMSVNQKLHSQTKAQVVVVTVKNLEGNSLEEYSTELFRSFGIGDSKLNNGVLMLIALEERQSRIEVGYGLEGILNDAKTGRIQDNYMIPYLKENNWNEGIKNGFTAIVNEIEKEYNVSAGTQQVYVDNTVNNLVFTSLIPFSLFATIIVRIISINKTKKNLIRTIYLSLITIITFIFTFNILITIQILLFNLFVLISRGRIGRFYGGGGGFSSGGGGFSGGGGSSGGGRKLTKFLI